MNKKRRSQLGQTATIAAPVLLILGLRSLFTAGPSDASAASRADGQPAPIQGEVAAPVRQATPSFTHDQQHAIDWRATLNFNTPLESPMDVRVEVVLLPTQAPEPVLAPAQAPQINPIEGLVLTGTMGNQNAAIAAISGKVYRIGEEVRPGWKLTSVDVRLGRILLTSESGETAELVKSD
ncbi:MAG: hypothetical protein NTV94_06140 [Planctomycetota bacterium]|nr:hypothetical protein [Planctomycetota bacterium]